MNCTERHFCDWQRAMHRLFLMRRALIAAGVTDPKILGSEIIAIDIRNLVDLTFASKFEDPKFSPKTE